MCCDVIEDLLVSGLGRDSICDGFRGGLSGSLRRSAVRTHLDSGGDPEAARIANLLPRRIWVLKTHSLILAPSAIIQQVPHLESYVALQISYRCQYGLASSRVPTEFASVASAVVSERVPTSGAAAKRLQSRSLHVCMRWVISVSCHRGMCDHEVAFLRAFRILYTA